METYYVYANDYAVIEFIHQMARRRNGIVIMGFPAGYKPGCVNSLLIYNKYLNQFSQYNGRTEIINYCRDDQYKTPLF